MIKEQIVKTVLRDHIKQHIFLTFQTSGCILLHESSGESSCRAIVQKAICATFIQQ